MDDHTRLQVDKEMTMQKGKTDMFQQKLQDNSVNDLLYDSQDIYVTFVFVCFLLWLFVF